MKDEEDGSHFTEEEGEAQGGQRQVLGQPV